MALTSTFRKLLSSRGDILTALLLAGAVTSLAIVLSQIVLNRELWARKRARDAMTLLVDQSSAETITAALHREELKYLRAMNARGCSNANTFTRALRDGSGCSGGPYTAFSGAANDLYELKQSCQIKINSSECHQNPGLKLLQSSLDDAQFEFRLVNSSPELQMIEIDVAILRPQLPLRRQGITVRTSTDWLTHLDSDGRVIQQREDPLAKCRSHAWGPVYLFDTSENRCRDFRKFGGGRGLAYSNGFFEFLPDSGTIVHLEAATLEQPGPYRIGEDGMYMGKKVFPEHSRAALINQDDITLIEQQIYSIGGQGTRAAIYAHRRVGNSNQFKRHCICPLGELGWAQSYNGIAALPWSEPLLSSASTAEPEEVTALFHVKTDAGDLLQVIITGQDPAINSGTPENSCSQISGSPYRYSCFVVKDSAIQRVELKRTYGIESNPWIHRYLLN